MNFEVILPSEIKSHQKRQSLYDSTLWSPYCSQNHKNRKWNSGFQELKKLGVVEQAENFGFVGLQRITKMNCDRSCITQETCIIAPGASLRCSGVARSSGRHCWQHPQPRHTHLGLGHVSTSRPASCEGHKEQLQNSGSYDLRGGPAELVAPRFILA